MRAKGGSKMTKSLLLLPALAIAPVWLLHAARITDSAAV